MSRKEFLGEIVFNYWNNLPIPLRLSISIGERYSDAVGFIRRRLRFDLLRTCVIALRGYKKNAAPEKTEDLEFNLRPVAARVIN